jgi:DnaK suppressor protein
MNDTLVRYSDEALAEFRKVIEEKLADARQQLDMFRNQILEVTENASDDYGGDWMDDSSINSEVEMLNNMAIRQQKFIQDLEHALIRINNKTYGICSISGRLIDKRRLLAVPTTTKSVVAKQEERLREEEKSVVQPTKTPYIKTAPSIVTIRKKTAPARKPSERPPSLLQLLDDDDEGHTQPLDFEETAGFDAVDAD